MRDLFGAIMAIALGVLIGTAAYRSTHAGARLITRAVHR